tara:strand:+ start:36933 stop:38867 length:1935 start_codon:yes stop_codon:yes gene_type:complete
LYPNENLELNARLNLLYRNAYFGIVITFIAATGLAFGFDNTNEDPTKVIWWVSISLLMLIRLLDSLTWSRHKDKGTLDNIRHLYRFRSGALLTAFLWSFYCLYFYSNSNLYELSVSWIIVSAMAGGSATVLSADRFVVLSYTQILLLPYSLLVAIAGNSEHQMIGFLGIAFSIVMFFTALKAATYTEDSIRLRYKHKNLLNNMKHEVETRTQEIVKLNQLDSLTNLLNRSAFIKQAEACINEKSKQPFSIFFIDMNGFKPVNDNFGHNIGDEILRQLSRRLQTTFAQTAIISRWGGDEFILLAKTDKADEIDTIAKSICHLFATPFHIHDYSIDMDVSIGVSTYPTHSLTLSELISYADVSMYSNKHDDKGDYVVFNNTLAKKVQSEFYLSTAITSAISNQQLSLVFQPIIDAENDRYHAVEALLRWNLDGEQIPPDIFIPIAERNGSIRSIGQWVLDESIKQQKTLEREGFDVKVCINVSVIQFDDPKFVNCIAKLLAKYDVKASNICIEITESVFSTDKPKIIAALKQLQALGIFISIDDFGTGYSSLSLIQDFGVHVVKIDRSFINRLDSNGGAIIKAVMVMGGDLNYSVVAEGIESIDQEIILKELGVQYLQGYLFSRPVPFNELLVKLRKKNFSLDELS